MGFRDDIRREIMPTEDEKRGYDSSKREENERRRYRDGRGFWEKLGDAFGITDTYKEHNNRYKE